MQRNTVWLRRLGGSTGIMTERERMSKRLLRGRTGTSSPELGVSVVFGDIFGFSENCEVSDNRAGYMPELSYGSHMFQDLVEARIRYHAVFNNHRTLEYHPDLLEHLPDLFPEICNRYPELAGMIRVRELENMFCWLDAVRNRCVAGITF